jgi:adenosylcobinamide-GDP ribazoletransferase
LKFNLRLLAAFQFLTILPVKRSFTTELIARSTMFFPVVGLAIGLLLALINWLLGFLIPSSVINILLVALLAFCSGGLHLDGLADTMDGAAGHRSVERRLEIMRDSRIGGFGAIGLILMLLMEYVFLNAIPGNLKWLALIAAPTISRWAMVYAIYAYPYARPDGLGKAFKEGVTQRQFVLASLIAAVVTFGLWGLAGVDIWAGAFIIVTLAALYLKSLLKGLTGDCYGAINEVATVSVFLVIIMLTHNNWLMHSWWF